MEPEEITEPLEIIEKFEVSSPYQRRLIFKACHDSILRSLLFVCTELFGWNEKLIIPQLLNSRWHWIKSSLMVSPDIYSEDELKDWDKFIIFFFTFFSFFSALIIRGRIKPEYLFLIKWAT